MYVQRKTIQAQPQMKCDLTPRSAKLKCVNDFLLLNGRIHRIMFLVAHENTIHMLRDQRRLACCHQHNDVLPGLLPRHQVDVVPVLQECLADGVNTCLGAMIRMLDVFEHLLRVATVTGRANGWFHWVKM